jgi:hypothetical protein
MSRMTRIAHSIIKDRETPGGGENLGKFKDHAPAGCPMTSLVDS